MPDDTVQMMRLSLVAALCCGALALGASGCGGESAAADGAVPASAALAPADALGFATVVADQGSGQWQRADDLLSLFPSARSGLLDVVRDELSDEELDWARDVEPALGPEVVLVVSADRRPIVLTQPDDSDRLRALLERGSDRNATAEIEGWTAIAERSVDLDAYQAALDRGTLETEAPFVKALEQLPADALARGWVDLRAVAEDVSAALEQAGAEGDLGLETLAGAVSAEEEGLLLTMVARTPGGGGTSYEPTLLADVPADAVAVLSFGGTQGTLDALQDRVDLRGLADQVEQTVGVSLDGLFEALSGEGVLYLRRGGEIPEVTLVLRPPDAEGTFETVDHVARRLAEQMGAAVTTGTQAGVSVSRIETDEATLSYALVDDRVVVTTGSVGALSAGGAKLTDAEAFTRAAEDVGLDERTRGLVYLDVDGLVSFVEGLAGADALPQDAREMAEKVDAVILQADGDGPDTQLRGFLRVAR